MIRRLLWLGIFAFAMAAVESAVVVYLREVVYPQGVQVPLEMPPLQLVRIEVGREIATIVMLVAVGMLSGATGRERFAYFVYTFGLWDIFYYVWLKAILDWPDSILEWDVLFLVPVPWAGPVLAPVLISVALIGGAVLVLRYEELGKPVRLTRFFWLSESTIGFLLILTFLIDYETVVAQQYPERFHWEAFLPLYLVGIGIFVWHILRTPALKSAVASSRSSN